MAGWSEWGHHKRAQSELHRADTTIERHEQIIRERDPRKLTARQLMLRARLDELPERLESGYQAIYALHRERDPIRYIGRTWNPRGRFLQHVWRQCDATAAWMGTFSRGNLPHMTILQLVTAIEAPPAEAACIRAHRERGVGLLNAEPGSPRRSIPDPEPPKPQIRERLELPLGASGVAAPIDLEHSSEKRWMAALRIAVHAGVLARCPRHERIVSTGRDLRAAYRLGNALIARRDPCVACYSSDRRALMAAIKHVLVAHAGECPDCRAARSRG